MYELGCYGILPKSDICKLREAFDSIDKGERYFPSACLSKVTEIYRVDSYLSKCDYAIFLGFVEKHTVHAVSRKMGLNHRYVRRKKNAIIKAIG